MDFHALTFSIIIEHKRHSKALCRIRSVSNVLSPCQTFPSSLFPWFPTSGTDFRRKGSRICFSSNHLPYASRSSRLFKLEHAPPWSRQDLFQGNVSSVVHKLFRRWVFQHDAVQGILPNHDVGTCTGLTQKVLRWSCFPWHAAKNCLSWHQLTKMPVLVNLQGLLGKLLLLVPLHDTRKFPEVAEKACS